MNDHTRLNVNLNQETADALKTAMDTDHISATEAIRRAISVYDYLRECRTNGDLVTVQKRGGREFALELI